MVARELILCNLFVDSQLGALQWWSAFASFSFNTVTKGTCDVSHGGARNDAIPVGVWQSFQSEAWKYSKTGEENDGNDGNDDMTTWFHKTNLSDRCTHHYPPSFFHSSYRGRIELDHRSHKKGHECTHIRMAKSRWNHREACQPATATWTRISWILGHNHPVTSNSGIMTSVTLYSSLLFGELWGLLGFSVLPLTSNLFLLSEGFRFDRFLFLLLLQGLCSTDFSTGSPGTRAWLPGVGR